MSGTQDKGRPPRPPPPDFGAFDDRSFSFVAWLAGAGSVLAATVQFGLICGSPRLLFFHASDAAPAVGSFSRLDRLFFLVPSLLAIGLGLFALRQRRTVGGGVVGIVLAVLALLLVSRVGFSR